MVMRRISLPSPPADDIKPTMNGSFKPLFSKTLKSPHRISKRPSAGSASSATSVNHDHLAHSVGMDGRHKRVWKACERCRMKKTKCDGEFPCKRCKDDGLICAAGVRKKTEYKQLPKGYAEVLEHTQFALIATVHKLYYMLRNNQPWDLGEPELNDHGEPVIHSIAQKLGCIRPNSDIDLPVHSIFPEDRAGMAELARQLEEQQQQQQQQHSHDESSSSSSSSSSSVSMKKEPLNSMMSSPIMYMDRASSSELDYSDFELGNYRRAAFGSLASSNPLTMSPQSLAGSLDFDLSNQTTPGELPANGPAVGLYPTPSLEDWAIPKAVYAHNRQRNDSLAMLMGQQPELLPVANATRDLAESVNYGIIKPNMLSACAEPGLIMGMGDPPIYTGYDEDAMTLL